MIPVNSYRLYISRFLIITFAVTVFCFNCNTLFPQERSGSPDSAMNISRQKLAVFSGIDPDSVLGIRSAGEKVFLVQKDGNMFSLGLADGAISQEQPLGAKLVDFALNGGLPVGLTVDGKLIGSVEPSWPQIQFQACRLDISDQEALLSGGEDSYFLAKNATSPVKIANVAFGLPFKDGFLWTIRRHSSSFSWQVELADMFGNRMKRIYRFGRDFDPNGLRAGPLGPENEILLSYFSGGKRELVMIGQNGRMMWRISVPSPVCARDIAWDNHGKLLFLIRENNELALYRWEFALPEG